MLLPPIVFRYLINGSYFRILHMFSDHNEVVVYLRYAMYIKKHCQKVL